MSESLNVIALISGGKDSLYSILHCTENGHKVVALANLFPTASTNNADVEGEDLNSFMYQTVGHSVIPLYAECLDIPLYRRAISGSAVQTGRYYDSTNVDVSADETEDLIPLLKEIMQAQPHANALCSGAILSTYQRTRVESVAIRLGLVPLAYLWQYPALPPPTGRDESLTGLLDDMSAAGCDARIIKIASGGIKESLLWANVADPKIRSRLDTGLRPFFQDHEFWLRGAVLGEGGEYETLAINGPSKLWKKRIEFPREMSTFTGEGGVSYLCLTHPCTVENERDSSGGETQALRMPVTFDAQFQAVLKAVQSIDVPAPGLSSVSDLPQVDTDFIRPVTKMTGRYLTISNLKSSRDTAADQIKQICKELGLLLFTMSQQTDRSFTSSDIVSTTLLLKNMSDFGSINSVYASLFKQGEPNPPARVTIACPLPENVEVSLSITLDLGSEYARRGLHVQSRSYWAPANIGPYSQAICVPLERNSDHVNFHDVEMVELIHVAGQIPLVPHTMQLLDADFIHQAVLSLQHMWRIGQERAVDMWPWAVAFLERCDVVLTRAELCYQAWRHGHLVGTRPLQSKDDSDEDGLDAWDLQHNRSARYDVYSNASSTDRHLHALPNLAVFGTRDTDAAFVPAFLAAEVISLPRNAPVEWWSMGIGQLPTTSPRVSKTQHDFCWGQCSRITVHPPAESKTAQSFHMLTILIRDGAEAEIERDIQDFMKSHNGVDVRIRTLMDAVQGTAFVSTRGLDRWSRLREGQLFNKMVIIPCLSLSGCLSDKVDANVARTSIPHVPDNLLDTHQSAEGVQSLAVAITMCIDEMVSA